MSIFFLARLIAVAGVGIAENIDGTNAVNAELAAAGVQFRDLDQIRHQIVEALRRFFGSMDQVVL